MPIYELLRSNGKLSNDLRSGSGSYHDDVDILTSGTVGSSTEAGRTTGRQWSDSVLMGPESSVGVDSVGVENTSEIYSGGEEEHLRCGLLSVRCANPDSRALNFRRLVGGGEPDGLEQPVLGLLVLLTVLELALRFIEGWVNHGWRIGVEVAQVVILVCVSSTAQTSDGRQFILYGKGETMTVNTRTSANFLDVRVT